MAKRQAGRAGDTEAAATSAAADKAPRTRRASGTSAATPSTSAKRTSKSATGRSAAAKPAAGRAKSASPGSTAGKAIEAAKSKAKHIADELPAASNPLAGLSLPSLPQVDVGHTVKAIGNQILGALNSDIGRVMVAELLIFVAKSLTTAAAETEAGKDAKTAILNAGAKIGAAAADAGARMVDTGIAAAATGANLVDRGTAAASSGADAATQAAAHAPDLVRDVAQVAVTAVGSVVADAAQNFMKRRGKKSDRQPGTDEPAESDGKTRDRPKS